MVRPVMVLEKSKVFPDFWGELSGKRNKSLFQEDMVYCSFHCFLKI